MKPYLVHPPRQSAGVTLIELMIASTLGIFILGFIFVMFQSTQASKILSTEILNIQQNTNNAFFALENGIQHAGFESTVLNGPSHNVRFPATQIFAAGQIITTTTQGDKTDIHLRLQGDELASLRDCAGQRIAPETLTNMTYTLNDQQELICAIQRETSGTTALPITEEVILADNIVFMKVIDIAKDQNTLQTQTAVTNQANPALKTLGMHIQLIFKSHNPVRYKAQAKEINLLGQNAFEANDRYYYQKATRFVAVKNQRSAS